MQGKASHNGYLFQKLFSKRTIDQIVHKSTRLMPCTSMHSDTMYVVSMCGCAFERAVHMRSDAVSDISVHMDSKVRI